MRRSTLGNMSPGQLNSRSGASNVPQRMGKQQQARTSLTRSKQPAPAPNAPKTGRPSLSRRSSVYGKGSQVEVETRPINDRAFQQDCIRSLVNYLTAHGYSNPVSQKGLQTPSSKDVSSIIEFLLLQLDPNWKTFKLEEDVPMIFKRLGYRVPISRSAIYAAGSPVSWPSLLAALAWLVDLLIAMEPAQDRQGESPFDEQRNRLFADFVDQVYCHFVHYEDEDQDALIGSYMQKVQEENEKYIAHFEAFEAEVNERKELLRKLKTEPSALAALEAKKVDYQEDIEKFNTVLSNFMPHKEVMSKKRDEKRQELSTKKEEVINIAKENEELRERIAAQEINAADVEKLMKETEILDVNLQSVINRKVELEKKSWDHEINSSKKLRDLETIVIKFNDNCERLGLKSADGSSDGPHFEIKLQPRANSPAEILGGATKTVIKPSLVKIIEDSKRTLVEDIHPEVLRLQDEVYKSDMAAQEMLVKISNAAAYTKKIEAQFKSREEKVDIGSKIAEREELEARTVEEELSLKNEEAEIEHALREAELELEAVTKMCNEEMTNARLEGQEMLTFILNSKEKTQATLNKVHEVTSQSIEVFRDLISSAN